MGEGILYKQSWSLQAGEATERVTNGRRRLGTTVLPVSKTCAGWWFQPHILWKITNVWNHQPARCPHHGTGYFENTLRLSAPRIKICGKSSCSHHIEAFQHCDESTQVGPSFPKRWTSTITNTSKNDIWLVVSTPLKNISKLGLFFPIYGKIKNVPNRQPDMFIYVPFFDPYPNWTLQPAGTLQSQLIPNLLQGNLRSDHTTHL